jgi:hypothetical protein
MDGSPGKGRTVVAWSGVPHDRQNVRSGGFSVPQARQRSPPATAIGGVGTGWVGAAAGPGVGDGAGVGGGGSPGDAPGEAPDSPP